MDLSKFYSQFREETGENVRVVSDGLLALEGMADQTTAEARTHLDAMFRAVHTVKGSSRLLGFADIGRLAHTMEDLFGAVRERRATLDRGMTDVLLRCSDALLEMTSSAVEGQQSTVDVEELVGKLKGVVTAAPATVADDGTQPSPTTAPAPQPAAVSAPATPAGQSESGPPSAEAPAARQDATSPLPRTRSVARQTVRVRTDRLDRLINLTGELVIGHQTLTLHNQALRELILLNQQQERTLLTLEQDVRQQRLPHDHEDILQQEINTLLNICDQMGQTLRTQMERFVVFVNQHHALVDDLEQEVISTRLLPISTVFGALPRAVRELANTTGKEVLLDLRGENTELDRKLLEALNDPLLHLVRNAMDHGIEPPDEREALGKPRQGVIRVQAEASGGEVRVVISDDGRGIDAQHMRDVAVKKSLISADNAALLSNQEALELIFLPGFTTAPILTDLSGRGVGMDVVRSNLDELNGQVVIESQPGQGTRITLLLPLTLVTTRVLLFQVGGQMFALPASGCHGIVWIEQEHIHTLDGRAMINHQEQTVPILRLADLLEIDAPQAFALERRMPAILLGNARRLLALLVDKLVDEREAVVKPIGILLDMGRRYTGAIQLGDGQLVLMLNPMTLAQTARGVGLVRAMTDTESGRPAAHLLVVDDSFTTRELVRSILQSAGYRVTAATDGADALDKLRVQLYDLVVSDVEMPRMNGFELTANIRREPGLEEVPVIIVTSLASDEHKQRGMEAGAQAYIVKSQFNQDNLLDAIQQLLGHN